MNCAPIKMLNDKYPVKYQGIDFVSVASLYSNSGINIQKTINELLRDEEQTLASQVINGENIEQLAEQLGRKFVKTKLDDATYELYRYLGFINHLKSGKNPKDMPIEYLSIARLKKYGGIGGNRFRGLRKSFEGSWLGPITTADDLVQHYKYLRAVKNVGPDTIAQIDISLREVGISLGEITQPRLIH